MIRAPRDLAAQSRPVATVGEMAGSSEDRPSRQHRVIASAAVALVGALLAPLTAAVAVAVAVAGSSPVGTRVRGWRGWRLLPLIADHRSPREFSVRVLGAGMGIAVVGAAMWVVAASLTGPATFHPGVHLQRNPAPYTFPSLSPGPRLQPFPSGVGLIDGWYSTPAGGA